MADNFSAFNQDPEFGKSGNTKQSISDFLGQSKAVIDVLAERRRQIEAEGWTTAHDDAHRAGEMALAAGCYALCAGECTRIFRDEWTESLLELPLFWPWEKSEWKPTDKRRNLIKAAALLLAEIERLDRKGGAS